MFEEEAYLFNNIRIVVEGLPPVRKVYAPKCEVVGIDPGPSRIAYFHE